MYTIYGDVISGNCYKIKLLLEQLRLDYQWQAIDILAGQSRSAEFLAKNPNGKIPVLQLPTGEYLAESNAILHYLAEGTDFLPQDRWLHAQVLQWMFFEQYTHEPSVAVARFIVRYLNKPEQQLERLSQCIKNAHRALAVMEQYLSQHQFFVGEQYTIADIALFAYTHVAHEGEVSLATYPSVLAWLERVRSQPYFVEMG